VLPSGMTERMTGGDCRGKALDMPKATEVDAL
jgi:hypothetical protein